MDFKPEFTKISIPKLPSFPKWFCIPEWLCYNALGCFILGLFIWWFLGTASAHFVIVPFIFAHNIVGGWIIGLGVFFWLTYLDIKYGQKS